MALTIVNVGYRSTNFWVVSAGTSRLLVDLGWPGTMGAFRAACGRAGVPLAEIKAGFATHFHPDHAGLAEELKRGGMTLVVFEPQVRAIPQLAKWMKPADGYVPITMEGVVTMPVSAGRAWLARLGIDGEIVHTPGHSDDSVSLLLDDGSVFTGDLTWPELIGPEDPDVVHGSWEALRARGAARVYAGHGPVRAMP